MKRIALFTAILLAGSATFAEAKTRFRSRLSLEVVGGAYKMPRSPNPVGSMKGLRGSYEINDQWFFGASWLTMSASGHDISGRVDMEMRGVMVEAERRFLRKRDKVRPYVRFGAGAGALTVNEMRDTIPLASSELGLRFFMTKHLNMTMAGYWNTGAGAFAGVGWRF